MRADPPMKPHATRSREALHALDGAPAAASALLSAQQAAQRLGVSKATLYAYVSRGLLRAVPDAADPRRSRYAGFDVERLLKRKGRRRAQVDQSLATLNEGWPVLETGVSGVWQGQLLYRGVPAVAWARRATVEDTARLLWQCAADDPFETAAPAMSARWHRLCADLRPRSVAERALSLLALAQADLPSPPAGADPQAMARAAAAQLRVAMACILGRAPSAAPVHRQCLQAWRLPRAAEECVRRALVLAADQELNMIAFVGRALVSVGASMPLAMLGAMCNLGASFNGGATEQVESMWDELVAQRDLESAIAARLERGEPLPGFNHLSYPGGDPRAAAILDDCARLARVPPIARHVQALTGWLPALDFALVALRRSLGLPRGAALTLQFGGRAVGVLAHLLEQLRSNQRVLIRGRYVGALPDRGLQATA